MSWSALSGAVAAIIFIVSSAIGYGILLQKMEDTREDVQVIRSEVKELTRSFTTFLINQPARTAARP
jgi:hypothetical protein